jgi:glutathione S-transferase
MSPRPGITLYGIANVPFTEKVRRALLYKRLEFELVEPRSLEDYKRWSPKTGMLPVLDIDGEHVPDSTEILYRLDELHPDPPLLSPDPTVAGQQRQLLEWSDQSFLWHYMRYRRMLQTEFEVPVVRDEPSADPEVTASDGGSPLRRLFAWLRAGGTWERPMTGLLRDLGLRLDDLVNFLGTRPFFYSQVLSVADLAVYAMLHTMGNDAIPGAARLIAERPSLVAFIQRVEDATGD